MFLFTEQMGEFFSGGVQTGDSYYLMPWLQFDQEEERDQKHGYLFRETARLHERTAQEIKVRREDIERHYEQTRKSGKMKRSFMNSL